MTATARPLSEVLDEHVAKVTAARAARGDFPLGPFVTADLDRMETDDRWLGFGYLGERRNFREAVASGEVDPRFTGLADAVDDRVIEFANHRGMTYEALFAWANSKNGRHFADVMLGSTGRSFEAAWSEAVRFNLHPDA